MWMRALGIGFVIAGACACPSKQASDPISGSGVASGSAVGGSGAVAVTGSNASATCDGIRAKVEGLYRDEAQRKEPKRVDEAVADNTAMVMTECTKTPAKVAPCVAGAKTITDIEKTCLAPLDPEGTEGDALGARK